MGTRRDRGLASPPLTVLAGGLRDLTEPVLREELWEAWRRLGDVEERVADLGRDLSTDLIALWAVWRLGGTDAGRDLLEEMVDDDYVLQFRDPMIEDMVLVAFSLGAGWANSRQQPR